MTYGDVLLFPGIWAIESHNVGMEGGGGAPSLSLHIQPL